MLELQEISDRIEINMLLDRYAGAIDRVDMELLDTVFLPDAWVDYTTFSEFGGIAGNYPEIREWLGSRLIHSPGHQHLVANREIALFGDRGTGRIMCLNPMRWPRSGNNAGENTGFLGLWYIDEYVRTPDGWRIAKRSEERCFKYNIPAL